MARKLYYVALYAPAGYGQLQDAFDTMTGDGAAIQPVVASNDNTSTVVSILSSDSPEDIVDAITGAVPDGTSVYMIAKKLSDGHLLGDFVAGERTTKTPWTNGGGATEQARSSRSVWGV